MKTVFESFKKNIKVIIIVLLSLILLRIYAHISFWFMLGIVLLFWFAQEMKKIATAKDDKGLMRGPKGLVTLGTVIQVIVVVLFLNAGTKAFFPRFHEALGVARERTDQVVAKNLANPIKNEAYDVWDARQYDAGKEMVKELDSVLAQGDPATAAQLLHQYEEKWDIGQLNQSKQKTEKAEEDVPSAYQPAQAKVGEKDGWRYEEIELDRDCTWFPDHIYQPGEKIIYEIRDYPVILMDGNGGGIKKMPGRYSGKMVAGGAPAFASEEGPATIRVYFK